MSNGVSIHIPDLHVRDRVLCAAEEDAHTGSKKLDELLGRIAVRQEPALRAEEQASLREVQAGKFKIARGQHRGDRRSEQRFHRDEQEAKLKELKEYLKYDPDEQAVKREYRRLHKPYVLIDRTAERARKQLERREEARRLELGEAFVERRIRSVEALKKMLGG